MINKIFSHLIKSIEDLIPLVVVIGFFQIFIIHQSIGDFSTIITGIIMLVIGLTLFMYGLKFALFPIGESLANSLIKNGSKFYLIMFAFVLGFGTTIAEPALSVICHTASEIARDGHLITQDQQADYVYYLRISVALAVGLATVIGVIKIIKQIPLIWIVMTGYMLVIIITFFAPDFIVGIAYDAGGVATSTITVPLITALGVGLANNVKGANPLTDGFGMIAIASLTPIIAVLIFGILWQL